MRAENYQIPNMIIGGGHKFDFVPEIEFERNQDENGVFNTPQRNSPVFCNKFNLIFT